MREFLSWRPSRRKLAIQARSRGNSSNLYHFINACSSDAGRGLAMFLPLNHASLGMIFRRCDEQRPAPS